MPLYDTFLYRSQRLVSSLAISTFIFFGTFEDAAAAEKLPVDEIHKIDKPIKVTGDVDRKLKRHILRIMHESLSKNEIRELTVKEVTAWKASPQKIEKGIKYETGVVTYNAQTIFGIRAVSLQAWLKDGKVKKWTYLKSGLPVK